MSGTTDWSAFFTLTGGAAATLLGLLFVSVSVAGSRSLQAHGRSIAELAHQSFQNYLVTLTVSAVMLMPGISVPILGRVLIGVIGSAVLWVAIRFIRAAGRLRHDWDLAALRRLASSAIGFILLLSASISFAGGNPHSFHLLAAGVLVLLGASVATSWDLLLRLRQAADDAAPHLHTEASTAELSAGGLGVK